MKNNIVIKKKECKNLYISRALILANKSKARYTCLSNWHESNFATINSSRQCNAAMVRVSLKLVSQTGRNFEPNTTFALNCAKQYSSPTFNRIIQGTRMVITCMIHNYGQFRQNKISCICQEQVLHDVRVMLAQE